MPAGRKKTGYIEASGKVAIPFQFQLADKFVDSRALVLANEELGMIDRRGRYVVPPGKYEMLAPPRDPGGLWAFREEKDGPWGLLDLDGRVIVQPSLWPIMPLSEVGYADGLFLVKDPNPPEDPPFGSGPGAVYLDNQGRIHVRIPNGYLYGMPFSEGLARAWRVGDGFGFMDKTGKVVIPPAYRDAGDFHEGLAAVSKEDEGPWGYIDRSGQLVIPIIYDVAGRFGEGLAAVERGGKWGYIDKTGKVVLPLTYGHAWPFLRGVAKVVIDGKIAFIDKTGKVLVNSGVIYEYF